jgi:hypothetical protein
MRRLIRSLALFLSVSLAWFAGGAQAQDARSGSVSSAAASAAVPAAENNRKLLRPALWKVADKDTTIYLFGTIHALPDGMEWLGGPVEAALRESAQLVTEIPETDPAEMQSAVISNAILPAGENLRMKLPEAERVQFEQALASFGLPVEAFDRFEPWYAAVALTALPLAREGYSAEHGVEEKISTIAKQMGRPRMGLETAAFQFSMFDSLPADVQIRYLGEVIKGLPTLDEELQKIIDEWGAGNADKLAELINADEDDPRMVTALLTNRNRMWADWIRTRMKRPGTVFMAVGAGHLAGKDSVQDLLKKRGLKAVRVQ